MNEKLKLFTKPLTPDEIEWKIQSKTKGASVKTIVVPYIDNRAVMNRLDSVFGSTEWKSAFQEFGGGVLCTLSIRNDDNGEWISKQDGADKTTIEPTKGGISDSMKRCATQWGLGRELYDYPRVFVEGEIKFIDKDVLAQLRSIDLKKDVIVLKQVVSKKAYNEQNKKDFEEGVPF